MVATETKRVYWTDGDYRRAVEDFKEKRLWSTTRLASDMSVTSDLIDRWLDGEPASAQLRAKLQRLVAHWEIPHPRAEDDDAPEIVTPVATAADAKDSPFAYLKREPAPIFEEGDTGSWVESEPEAAVDDTPSPAIEVELVDAWDNPFPKNFAVVWNIPMRTTEPVIRVRDTDILLTKAMLAALGNPTHIVIAGNPDTGKIAVAPSFEGAPFALKLNSKGALGISAVRHLGFPPGHYVAIQEGRCWIATRAEENA